MIGERPPGPKGDPGAWYAAWGHGVCPLSQILAAGKIAPSLDGVDCPPSLSPLRPGRLEDPCHTKHFWSLHAGGANFAFADGSVRFLAYRQSEILPALATRAGGEVVSAD